MRLQAASEPSRDCNDWLRGLIGEALEGWKSFQLAIVLLFEIHVGSGSSVVQACDLTLVATSVALLVRPQMLVNHRPCRKRKGN